MNSRERILERVKSNQPKKDVQAYRTVNHTVPKNLLEKFKETLISIGGSVLEFEEINDIKQYLIDTFPLAKQVVTHLLKFDHLLNFELTADAHELSTIDVAVLEGDFGVSENGAVWLTQKKMLDLALPFICENLILVIKRQNILPTLHEAYHLIGDSNYDYGTFIAGPSKTADIEQSLVLGAHGPKTLTVILLK